MKKNPLLILCAGILFASLLLVIAACSSNTGTGARREARQTARAERQAGPVATVQPPSLPGGVPSRPSSGSGKRVRGIYAVTAPNQALQASTFANANISGIVIRTFWSSVEPSEGQFDWSFVDGQVQQATAAGKQVILIVLPGAFTPAWARQGVQTATFDSKYGFTAGQPLVLPVPWDQTYLNRWFAFVSALGQRYDPNPAVVMVPATGPTSVSAEMSLPNGSDAVAQWEQLGYTTDKYLGAWKQTLGAYAQAFPTSEMGLTLYPGLPIPDASESDKFRQAVTAYAVQTYGGKVTVQTSGLSARKQDHPRLGYELVQQYAGETTVGFEMGTSATEKPERMGAADAVSALQASINFGLSAGAKFLEIYEKDIDNPAMQDVLLYARMSMLQ